LRRVYVALGWALVAAIVWLSLTPSPPQVEIEQGDKAGHFLAYGGVMLWFALLYTSAKIRALYAASFIAMGIAIEFVQGWTGYRSFEVADMVVDGVGVLLGWTVAHFVPIRL
jgi:VanZ family protein